MHAKSFLPEINTDLSPKSYNFPVKNLEISENMNFEPTPRYLDFVKIEKCREFSYLFSPICVACGKPNISIGIFNATGNLKRINSALSEQNNEQFENKTEEFSKSVVLSPCFSDTPDYFNFSKEDTDLKTNDFIIKRNKLRSEIEELLLKYEETKKNKEINKISLIKEEKLILEESKEKSELAIKYAVQNMILFIKMLEEKRNKEKEKVNQKLIFLKQILHHEKSKLKKLQTSNEKLRITKIRSDHIKTKTLLQVFFLY